MKTFWNDLREVLTSLFQTLGWAWWIEIVTQTPRCTYYFGPFLSAKEANAAKAGYIEDLEQEGAQEIIATLKRCKPATLTIADDLGERVERRRSTPVLSGQL